MGFAERLKKLDKTLKKKKERKKVEKKKQKMTIFQKCERFSPILILPGLRNLGLRGSISYQIIS